MISSTAEYALRAMVNLALNPGRAESVENIAHATKVPQGYLSKVMQDLGKAGLVNGRRGPNGGFSLARPPADISLLDVINAVDPLQRIRTCPLGIPSHGTRLCALHQRLDDAMAHVESAFARASLAELIDASFASAQCSFPTLERHPLPASPQAQPVRGRPPSGKRPRPGAAASRAAAPKQEKRRGGDSNPR